jgi:hypothetical protein
MKLFKIYQDANSKEYDVYSAAVVAAKNENEARKIHPDGETIVTSTKQSTSTWVPLKDVRIAYLGEAKKGTKAGVIVASYYAG